MQTSSKRRWIGLVFISLAVSLIIVDSTIVNVAIPAIVDDLGVTSTQVQWIQESYTLVFAALLLVFGVLADRFGRRRLLLLGVVIFASASVLAALSQSGDLLIGSRILQGIGGAMVLPATLSIINSTFRGKERALAFAVWGSTIGGMSAVGPLLGGWLTTYFSWRWAFGINIPLGIIIVIGVLLSVDESSDSSSKRAVDFGGAALSIATCATLVFGLIEGRNYGWLLVNNPFSVGGWTWPFGVSPVPVAFVISVLTGVIFVKNGRSRARRGAATLLDFSLFSIPSFRNGNIAAMIVSMGEFGIILSLPIWLQNVLGYSALQTGLLLLPLAAGSFAASGFAGAFGNKIKPVTIVRVGIGLEIIGVALLGVMISSNTPWGTFVPFLFIYGLGVGLATAQLTGVVLKDISPLKSGQASGTQSTARQVGSALGIAILGTVLFSTATVQLDNSLKDQNLPQTVREKTVTAVVESSGAYISVLQKEPANQAVAEAAREAFSNGTKYSAYFAAGFLTLGLIATASLDGGGSRRDPARGVDDDVEETATPA